MKRIFNSRSTGSGPTLFEWQHGSSHYLASASSVGTSGTNVRISDRKGALVDTIVLQAECLDMKWSPNGDCLAVIENKSQSLVLWDALAARGTTLIDTGMKSMEYLSWASNSDLIAVTTSKGNLFLYERKSGKKTPVIGKHTKAITAAAWSPKNDLACASVDKSVMIQEACLLALLLACSLSVTLSNKDGDTIFQMGLKNEASQIKWTTKKASDGTTQHIVSMVVGSKNLLILNQALAQQPTELTFNQKYGTIAKYQWLKEGQVMIGFASGYLTIVSTSKDLGTELFQSKSYKDCLNDVVISRVLNTAATCGDSSIKIHDLSNLQDVSSIITLENERGTLEKLQYSDDGQFLTVGTKDGSLYTYLSKLPTLGHTCFNRVLAVGIGAKVKFYGMSPTLKRPSNGIVFEYNHPISEPPPLTLTSTIWEKEYPASVQQLFMNEQYAIVLLENNELHLHPLEEDFFNPNSNKAPLTLVFPEDRYSHVNDGQVVEVTCAVITDEFMIYGTAHGALMHYDLDEILMVNDYQHTTGIKSIFPPAAKGVLWETAPLAGRYVFLAWDDSTLTTFVYTPFTVKGPQCRGLVSNTTHLPYGLKPVLFLDGITQGGKIEQVKLMTHEEIPPEAFLRRYQTDADQGRALRLLYIIGKLKNIWALHPAVTSRVAWTMLAEAALHSMDIAFAKRVYRQVLEDPSMVMNLTRIESVEERAELQGHVAVIFGDFNLAQ
eukprot:jgi/Hompol1/6794/HPOL_005093-RA